MKKLARVVLLVSACAGLARCPNTGPNIQGPGRVPDNQAT